MRKTPTPQQILVKGHSIKNGRQKPKRHEVGAYANRFKVYSQGQKTGVVHFSV